VEEEARAAAAAAQRRVRECDDEGVRGRRDDDAVGRAAVARDCLALFESLLPLVADVPETAPVPAVDTAGGGARKRARAPDGAPHAANHLRLRASVQRNRHVATTDIATRSIDLT
jgi:hypothetical protein